MNTTNRLQFRYHEDVFDTRKDAIEYIEKMIRFTEEGLASEDPSYGYSLLAEPTVLLYKNITEDDETGEDNPHLIIAIGSVTNEGTQYSDNRFCIIDIDKTEQEIADLGKELEKAIKSLTIIPKESDSLKLFSEKTDDGTFVSGDVKVAESHIFNDIKKKNNLMVTPEGLFIYVNLEYDEANESFTFSVSNSDGTLSATTVDLSDNYLVGGMYSVQDQSLHLKMKDGESVVIDCTKLIKEWDVEDEASRTPIVLKREEVGYGYDNEYAHLEPWQDVLSANIRIKDEEFDEQGKPLPLDKTKTTNILQRTRDGKYLYVDGKASNIIYYKNGELSNVKEALDALNNVKLSTDSDNMLMEKTDGFFASSKLEYKSNENKLIFKVSGQKGEKKTEIQLNSVELFEHIYYDPTKEALILTYKDNTGETQFVEIPIGEMIKDWEWEVQNEGHNVKLVKIRNKSGNDKLSADVKLFEGHNNILVDTNHTLYVRGEADNIKYGETSNVKEALDNLKETDAALDNKINIEVARATAEEGRIEAKLDREINDRIADVDEEETRAKAEENRIDTTIGSGFSTDAHETVTYKFNKLQNQVDSEADKLQNEIDRSTAKDTEHDGRLDAIDAEIGDGFGPRNTVRDEINNLQGEVDAVSAETATKLKDLRNIDHSINVDNSDPTIPVVSVNLSEEIEDDKPNIIKLNNDGLYAGVDLIYEFNEEVGTNQLIFKTTNGTKIYDLQTNSVVDKIYYDPSREAIIIEYTINGKKMPDVVIPVGDLINEWRVWDGHEGAVQLEKTRIASGSTEQDVLKASVVISDVHDDNIIVNDGGALYVSGKGITDNAAAIDALEGRMGTAESDIDTLEDGLANEITRAISAETALKAAINNEAITRESEDTRIETKLDDEITRSVAKDNEHDAGIERNRDSISGETRRAETAENIIASNLSTEVARAKNAESAITTALETEISDRQHGDEDLSERINNEAATRQSEDNRIEGKLDAEITRSTNKDTSLENLINTEKTDRISGDTALESKINAEVARSTSEDARIETKLNNEINRSVDKDNELLGLINTETANRVASDEALDTKINGITLSFEDTPSIDFTKSASNVVTANVKLQDGENIIKVGEGLYASVTLSYDSARNTIKLVTSNGEQEAIQLNTVGSLIDGIEYDSTNRALIIRYHDAAGNQLSTSFPVNELFNDWIIDNPTNNSAVELTKIINSGDTADVLFGKILITDDHDGDGKPDQGSDNLIEIRNNGLYVNGSAMSGAVETAECAKNELKAVEKAVFGHIAGDCGSGFTYEPMPGTTYINTATTVNNATFLLDLAIKDLSSYTESIEDNLEIVSANTECAKNELKTVENNILGMPLMNQCGEGDTYRGNDGTNYIFSGTSFNNVDIILDREIKNTNDKVSEIIEDIETISSDTICTDSKAKKLYELLYGQGSTMQDCGSGTTYQPYTLGCVINSATSFSEADAMLDKQICEILTMWVSGETCSSRSNWTEDGANRKLQVDVKLSHGNTGAMSDDDFVTETLSGDYIDPTNTEFTDTNALRLVCLQEGPSGTTPTVDTKQNGLYLSNVWDCGLYYSSDDAEAKAAAEAAGYKTDYYTDETAEASNYNYMNNVRQNDPIY